MTSLLVLKEHLKDFYARHSTLVRIVLRFILCFSSYVALNINVGYMQTLRNPVVILLLSAAGALLPWGASVFLVGCAMAAHISSVSLEMTLIAVIIIMIAALLYYSFKPGDSFLLLVTPLAFMLGIPYAVPLLVGLGGSVICAIPVGVGVFIYYMLDYVKQNAGVLTNEASVDTVQRFSQIIRSVVFNDTMILMIAACAAGILVVYLIRRLSIDYSWLIAIVAGCVTQLLVVFVGDLVFGVSVSAVRLLIGLVLSALLAAVYDFFAFSVDYSRTEYVQFEDDDYYYYVKAVPKMTVSTPNVKVKKINSSKKSGRERVQR